MSQLDREFLDETLVRGILRLEPSRAQPSVPKSGRTTDIAVQAVMYVLKARPKEIKIAADDSRRACHLGNLIVDFLAELHYTVPIEVRPLAGGFGRPPEGGQHPTRPEWFCDHATRPDPAQEAPRPGWPNILLPLHGEP